MLHKVVIVNGKRRTLCGITGVKQDRPRGGECPQCARVAVRRGISA